MTIDLNMSNEDYHALPTISSSAVKTVSINGLARWKFGQRKSSTAFDMGTAAHALALEPEADLVRRGPETRRGNAWKEAHEEAQSAGALLLTAADYDQAMGIADSVKAHREASKLLSGKPVIEASIFAYDPSVGLDLRCRPDAWRRDIGCVVDLKTTISASPEEFAKSAMRFGYHIQESFYRRVMALAGEPIDRFIFIAVEKEPPFVTAVYELDSNARAEADAAVDDALAQIASAQSSGIYPTGYEDGVTVLALPSWGFRFNRQP